MKEFVVYSGLRLGLFVLTYAALAALWVLAVGRDGLLLVPFLGAVVLSSVLSWKFLAPQREAFAARVQSRAERMSTKYEEMRAREDTD